MKERRLQIRAALESLKANERAKEFQSLAAHLAKRRWPELVVTEPKADGGEDATSFQPGPDGKRRRLACSLTGTWAKLSADAQRQRERGLKTDVLVFVTTESVSNLTVDKWAKDFQREFGHDLEVLGQAELINELERPENDWLCVEYLGVDAVREDLATYFEHVIGRSDKLLLAGLDPKASDPQTCQRLDLANVYIELSTDLRRPRREEEKTSKAGEAGPRGMEDSVTVSALEAASDHPRLVLTGKPGSGKTTFVRHLCLCFAQHFQHPQAGWLERLRRSGWREGAFVPVVVELRFFARSLAPEVQDKPQPRALWDFFVLHVLKANALEGLRESLLGAIQAGRALVIFEGLDEVPTGPQRAHVKQAIEEFAAAAQFKASRVLVTCRSRAYAQPALHLRDIAPRQPLQFTVAPLADFDQARILRFTQSWYAELARLDPNLRATESARADRLYRAIQAPSLWPQAGRPMLLTVMANVHAKNDQLPRDRAQVYAEMVEILVESCNEFDPARANCGETGLKATSPAGCFPAGASPCGVHDMSGNVWEWTRSLWGPNYSNPQFRYPYDPSDGREDLGAAKESDRVLRGGSWNDYADGARCAVRDGDFPDVRLRNFGFRLVASPFFALNSDTSDL